MPLQRLDSRRGRGVPPELVDQQVTGHGLVRAQKQQRQERSLLTAAKRQHPASVPDLDRAEDAELHSFILAPLPDPYRRWGRSLGGRPEALGTSEWDARRQEG